MAGVGLEGAFGADAVNQIRAAIVQRLQQAQEMRLRDEQMGLQQRGADRADRALDQQDDLKRALMAQSADLKDQTALDTMINQGAYRPGQELSAGTAQRFQKHGVGDLVEPQQSLSSTQMQGGAAMPQLRGRMIPQSGAVGPEQGEASSGVASSSAQAPMLTGRLMFRGTQKQADTTAERERKIQHDSDQSELNNWKAGISQDLANFKMSQPAPAETTQLKPEVDPATGKETGRYFAYNPKAKRFDLVAGPGPMGTKAAPGAAQGAEHERSKKEALGSLDQLDQAIEQARALIGPGAGRVSNIQQMIGNPDPKVQALGTKMLLAKMQVDHAATGTVRAGASPQLLARWDNILGNVQNAESLKASVQAMREILGGQGTGGGTVKMKAPNGQVSNVPADQVEHFKAKGAVIVP